MLLRRVSMALLMFMGLGCGIGSGPISPHVHGTTLYWDHDDDGDTADQVLASNKENPIDGRMFCRSLEASARGASAERSQEAWGVGLTASTLLVGSAVMAGVGAPEDEDAAKVFRGVNVGLAGLAAGLGALTVYLFERSSAASTLAGVAANGAGMSDDVAANLLCNEALGGWNEARATSLKTAMDTISAEQKKALEDAKKAAEEAKKTADEAKTAADEAKKAADEAQRTAEEAKKKER